eukprot:Gregarina_sp_Poly_1__3560@NODE_2040_length_2795_cov_46_990469_g1316_i0_p2_GENE_NODE_2040_length_2795_cov_46_990469_g1316_i0NODE_2040_length_2795_cov_46_990469_g1316_i0_p2_ORF_typecomplete_len299_score26_68Yip1/PF04893_17/1_8e05DUF1360/PF07098_11/1e02DUF1360/PF07098_11/0_078ECF_trnsprt/PF12822_7/0_17_NODE_2040_length_2795_cov_46_990469_g1316_i052948
MISLDDRLSREPYSQGIGQNMEFVTLSTSSPPLLPNAAHLDAEPSDGFESAHAANSWPSFLSSKLLMSKAQHGVIQEKFNVPWNVVKNELKAAATSSLRVLSYKSSRTGTGGTLSDVTDTFAGDWWGPIWVAITMAVTLCLSPNASRIFYLESSELRPVTFPMISAMFTIGAWVAALTGVLYFFVNRVVRDPTFFGQPSHRLKIFSIAGYSLVPHTTALLIDVLLGALGAHRNRLWHFLFVCLTPALAAAFYIADRFPLRAIGAFAAGFDRRSCRTVFWMAYTGISILAALALQSFFS